MRRIFKYALDRREVQNVKMGRDPKVISVGLDPRGALSVWAEVDGDPDAPKVTATVHIVGTGQEPPPGDARFVGTVRDSQWMWHVYVSGA